MTFTYEVPDGLIPSVEQYLAVQIRQVNHPVSGAQIFERIPGHESPAAFFKTKLDDLLHQMVNLYPSAEVKAQLDQIKAHQDTIRAMAAAAIVPAQGKVAK